MNRRTLLRGFAAVPAATPSVHGPPVSLPKRDCRSTQFEVAVAFGESTTEITDQPTAALLKDLKQRGLLDSTLLVWGGEFGRTPMAEQQHSWEDAGRDHHPN